MKSKEVKVGSVVFERNAISEFGVREDPTRGYQIVHEATNWRAPDKWEKSPVKEEGKKGILVREVIKKDEGWEFSEHSYQFAASLISMVLLEEYRTKCAEAKVESDRETAEFKAKVEAYRALEKRAEALGYEVRAHDTRVKVEHEEFERLLTELETLRAK